MEKIKTAFICVHNSCRSQMAEAIAKAIASGSARIPTITPDIASLIKLDLVYPFFSTLYNSGVQTPEIPDTKVFIETKKLGFDI